MKQVCHLIVVTCAAFLQLGTDAVAQEEWRHEKLLSQVYDVAASPQDVWINSRGDVAYFATVSRSSPYTDAYRNRENVSEWLGSGRITSLTHGISESGHVLFRAGWRNSQGRMGLGLYVNDSAWWEQVYSGGQYMELMVTEGGVDDRGIPVYRLREDKPGGNYYLYQGHRLVQDGILSGQTWIGMPKVNASGQLAWHGRGDETGGKSHVFLDDYPLSRSIVGPNYAAAAAYLNRRGDVLWTCPDLNGYTDIFINDVNYSRSHFGNARRNYHAYARGMNDNGDIVWSAIDWNLGYGYPDVFKNHENLSLAVYGDIPRAAFPMGISNTGQAVWIGFREGLEFKNTIWRDTTDISNPVLGPTGTPTDAPQIDNWGRVMWWAYGPQFNGWVRTFVDSLDISADALGDDVWNYTCKGVKIGPNGHVFWIAVDLRTNLADVWLSTPVPEPSGIAGVGLMMVWLASRRARRV